LYDNDNVLLLHPASANSGFQLHAAARPARGAHADAGRFVVATICYFKHKVGNEFIDTFDRDILPLFERSSAAGAC
jgi:hypothetical protein